jgi:ribosomal protein S12 methylthiotransferase accessory factor
MRDVPGAGRSSAVATSAEHVAITAKRDLGGTVRYRDPADTLAWIRPLLPAFGITRIANVTGLDRIGIPVWMCIRPNARCLSVSQGKGVTDELAQISAIMESIELYHAEKAAEPDMVASYHEVRRRHQAVDPGGLLPGVRWQAYHPARTIAWLGGTDLVTGEPVFVPHVVVDENFSRPHPDLGLFFVTTTGLASGNHRLEALCHAVFEVVERDCEWHWEQLSPTARRAREVDPGTIDALVLRRLLDRFVGAGILARMWDMTSEVGIPAYHCTLSDPQALSGLDPYYGAGCHLSKEIALSRALTEAAQSRLTFISGSRDDVFPSSYERATYVIRRRPGVTPGRMNFDKRPSPSPGSTFDEDLRQALRLLCGAGFRRVVAVELTRPEFGVPVVKVVVPGMRELREG